MIERQTNIYVANQDASELERHLNTGATPLAGIEYPDVQKMQNDVRVALLRRIARSAPQETPLFVRSFMVHSFLTRFAGRASKNYDSYAERLVTDIPADAPPDFFEQHERAMRGTASPEELMIVRRTLGMRAIELARLTHPYGAMIDQLDLMRDDVAVAVASQGGILFEPRDYNEKFKLRSTGLLLDPERGEQVMSLLITRRRDSGMVDDDSLVMERSSFIVPVHEGSAYDPTLSKRMREVRMVDNPHRLEELAEVGRIHEVVPELLKSNNFSAAIPQSTTIFEFNQTTDREIDARKASLPASNSLERIRALTKEYEESNPGMVAAMQKAMDNEQSWDRQRSEN